MYLYSCSVPYNIVTHFFPEMSLNVTFVPLNLIKCSKVLDLTETIFNFFISCLSIEDVMVITYPL